MRKGLVTVVGGFVGTVLGEANILGLFVAEDSQLDVELFEVSASDFLI